MDPTSDEYFKGINFNKSWEEEDWERFFAAQDRFSRDRHGLSSPAPRPGTDPTYSFRGVLERFGMDADNPTAPPRPFHFSGEPAEEAIQAPRFPFWREGADHETLPIYCQARFYAHRVSVFLEARFSKVLRSSYKSPAYQDLQKALMEWSWLSQSIPRLLVAAHGLGYDAHGVKGNIVRCRRALTRADDCVAVLSKISRRSLTLEGHRRFSQETLKLRNGLRDWIDLLRDRFAPPGRKSR